MRKLLLFAVAATCFAVATAVVGACGSDAAAPKVTIKGAAS